MHSIGRYSRTLAMLVCVALFGAVSSIGAPYVAAQGAIQMDCAQISAFDGEVNWQLPTPRVRLSHDAQLQGWSPLGYWRFVDAAAITNDAAATGVGANGLYHAGASAVSPGPLGTNGFAARFDAAQLQYAEIAHANEFLVDEGTLSLWARPTGALSPYDKSGLFSKDSSAYDDGGQITLWYRGVNDFRFRIQSIDTSYHVESDDIYLPGRWYHVVASFGPAGLRLYVDGALVDVDAYTGGLAWTSGGSGNLEPIVLGASGDRSGDGTSDRLEDYFTGDLAEVALLGVQLTDTEIAGLYNARLPFYSDYAAAAADRAPVGYYRFGEAAGDEFRDGSYAGLVGPFAGVTAWNGQAEDDATEFTGGSALVDTADAPRLSGDLSLALFVRPNTNAGTLLECSGDGLTTDDHSLYRVALTNTGLFYSHEHASGVTEILLPATIPTSNWSHVLVTRDATSGQIDAYVDGVWQSSGIALPAPDGGSNGALWIARGVAAGSEFNGAVDELLIFDRILDDQEIALLSNPRAGRSVELREDGQAVALVSWETVQQELLPTGPGPFQYCLQAIDNGLEYPLACCELRMFQPPVALSCHELDGAVELTWQNGEEYDSVEIYRDGVTIASIDGASTSFSDFEVLPGQHLYEVAGVIETDTTLAPNCNVDVELTPTNFTCTIEADEAVLTWQSPRPYDSTHLFQDGQLIATLPGTTHEYVVAELEPGDYAFDVAGEIASVATELATCDGSVLAGPTNLEGCSDNGAILLEWVDPVGFEIIEIRKNGVLIAVVPGQMDSFYFVGDGDGGHLYDVRGRIGGVATVAAYLTSSDMRAPAGLTSTLDGLCDTDATVELSWSNLDPFESIEVWRNGVLHASLPGSQHSYLDTVPSQATTWWYSVVGIRELNDCVRRISDIAVDITEPTSLDGIVVSNDFEGCASETESLLLTVISPLEGDDLSYEWRLDGTVLATTKDMLLSPAESGDSGLYTLRIDNGCTVVQHDVSVELHDDVQVTFENQDAALCAGDLATLTVAATGQSLTYQWYVDGAAISGATNSSLTVESADAPVAQLYTVEVTASCGAVTADVATLTTLAAPAIISEPQDTLVCPGTPATFMVMAVGEGPFSYSWYHNGTPLVNDAPTLTIALASEATRGRYSVEVTGACGTVTSQTATLEINELPQIVSAPTDAVVCSGGQHMLTVVATGPQLTYEWLRNGTPIPGGDSATLTLDPVTTASAGNYEVVVSSNCGSVTSAPATLTVSGLPLITTGLYDREQCLGDTVTLTVSVLSASDVEYLWFRNGTLLTNSAATLTLTDVTAADAGHYAVAISNPCGEIASQCHVLISGAPEITQHPVGGTYCTGDAATLGAAATDPDADYQWYRDGQVMPGAENATLILPQVELTDAGDYWLIVTNDCGTASTTPVTLNVEAAPYLTSHLEQHALCLGDSVTLSVTPTGTAPFAYTWRQNGQVLAGADSAELVVGPVTAASVGQYSVTVTNDCGTSWIVVAEITVLPETTIVQQPLSQLACAGDDLILAVEATGSNLRYQWRHNGFEIPGATSREFLLGSVSTTAAGTYDVVVNGDCGNAVTSNTAIVTIDVAPQITQSPSGQSLEFGSAIDLTVVATGSGPLHYQWYLDGVALIGETMPTLSIVDFAPSHTGSYYAIVSNRCGDLATPSFTLDGYIAGRMFRRGDANDDGSINTADAIYLLNYLFANGQEPPCMDAADVNDNGGVNLSDAVQLLNYLFAGAAAPAAPFTTEGFDPTDDELPCLAD